MIWLNIKLPVLRGYAFRDATSSSLGVWVRLVAYCCEQENGGTIVGAGKWTARTWLTTVGVEMTEINESSELWRMDALGTLFVTEYPAEKELEIRAKRIAGKRTANLRWGTPMKPKSKRKKQSDYSSANSSATKSAYAEEEEETEGKRNTALSDHVQRINGNHAPITDKIATL